MKNNRWYENIADINELLSFIESLDENRREIIAQHLLQIIISECKIDIDNEISKFSKNDYAYKRWYDEDFNLSSSLEILKNLPEIKQKFVIDRLMTEIVMAFAKKEL